MKKIFLVTRLANDFFDCGLTEEEEKIAAKFNPRSLKNLGPYQKGKSGNPGGRPGNSIRDATHEWLKQIDAKTGKTNAELVAQAQGKKALKGDIAAYNAFADRTEGKPAPVQAQQHE